MAPNLTGATLMMCSMAAFTVNDAIVKAVGADLPLFQLVTMRGVLATTMIYILARHLGALHLNFPLSDKIMMLLRCLCEIGVTFFFLSALLHMPLANVTAVLQALPLTVTLGAALIFKETVGWRRATAIAVGFAGMLLIVRPGPDGFNIYALYALAAVALITARDLLTRRMSAAVPSMVVTLATSISITIVAAFASLTTEWVPVSAATGAMIVSAAVLVLLGYMFSVMVMRVGEVGFVAPFRYSGLLWALLLGWLMFGDWPDPTTLFGGALVVGAGLFTLFRERAVRG